MPLVEARSLTRSYGELAVLTGVDLQLERGEVLAVQGASGTGKSTLLNILGLLDRADAGSYRLDGIDTGAAGPARRSRLRATRIGFIFQGFHLLPEFSVVENILMPARCAGRAAGSLQRAAGELLDQVGLGNFADKDVTRLSGGERQRVALCRALLLKPPLILADEPTGNLDPATADVVLHLLLELANREHCAVLLVTHDTHVAGQAHRRLVLAEGVLQPPLPAERP